MDKLERIYQLQRLLKSRRMPITRLELADKLDCSRATLTRLIKQCRDHLHWPLEFDTERQGYYIDIREGESFELPGLWFNSSEIHALLTSHRLLAELKPGILEPYISPLKSRLESLLQHKHAGSKEIFERVRILPMAPREPRLEEFRKITDALVNRARLRIQYQSRSKDELSERWISPQRLVYYRDNWYLDAWCHLRQGLRTFSIDRMNVAEKDRQADDVPDQDLDAHFTRTYGIFAGPATHEAVIRFSSEAARWVADEQWHPQQQSHALPDGAWEIVVPYGDPTELVRDILKFGAEAEVIAPSELRELVADSLSQALRKYRKWKKV